MIWAHQPGEQNGLIAHNIFTFVKYSEDNKTPLTESQIEDNLMSIKQEIYLSLVMWTIRICDRKKEQHNQKKLNLWQSTSCLLGQMIHAVPKRGGGKKKSLLNERCSSMLTNKYFLYLKEHFNLFFLVQLNSYGEVNCFSKA